jgi:hypothetical protein
MAGEYYFLIALLLVVGAYIIHRAHIAIRQYRKFRGKMLVECPETHKAAAVKVAGVSEAMAAFVGQRHVELNACSRWPERAGCDQDCLSQLETDPESHRVWQIASQWFAGKQCVYCGKPIEHFGYLDHRPALLDAANQTVEWDKIPAEKLPEKLSSCRPVCWDCHVAETFRREHLELVVDRPRH